MKQKKTEKERRKPSPKTRQKPTPKRELRREVVARGVAALKPASEIAKEAGVTRQTVQEIKAEPETRMRVAQLLAPHQTRIERLIDKTLISIEKGLEAPAFDMFGNLILDQKTGEPYPNFTAQSAARKDFIALLGHAQPKQQEQQQGLPTLTQINILIQQHEQQKLEAIDVTAERIN